MFRLRQISVDKLRQIALKTTIRAELRAKRVGEKTPFLVQAATGFSGAGPRGEICRLRRNGPRFLGWWGGTSSGSDGTRHTLNSMVDQTYLVTFEQPDVMIESVIAATAEMQGAHLIFLDAKGKLVALFLLELVQSWIVLPR
ncbi:MAG: hypothetical protein QOH35_2084 [Acidobacteriaceae bacterium]|nr:hypothetical protein [Acidobacteriaceae bacterium]